MTHLILAAAGGAVGASLRYLTGIAALRLLGPNFPWGTLIVNVVGSFVMGLFIAALARMSSGGETLRVFIATGLLGGFTTFSAFSLDFASLWERGETLVAASYAVGSVALSLAAIFFGLWLSRSAFA